ncbi:hypothetical protein [Micromonospora sp. WMMD737]|uniref:hypothetical protein n=1 Tax=Micromonospora sp. WMMD737 TaxID=3404113 RepID=UPI003B931386
MDRRPMSAAAVLDEHQLAPSWDCHTCGQPWPCPPAQTRLAEDYQNNRVGLRVYGAGLYAAALAARPEDDAGELYERILGWMP